MAWAAAAGQAVGGALAGGGAYAAGAMSARASKRMYQKRYQWTVEDLKKAGLNPMLAAFSGQPTPAQPHFENVGAAAAEGFGKATSAIVAKKMMESQVDKNAAEAEKARAEAGQANSAAAVNQAMIPEIAARTENYGWSSRELAQRIENQKALLPEITARVNHLAASTRNLDASTVKLKAELGLIASQIGKNESEIRWNDLNFHQKAKLFPLIQSTMQSEAWVKRYGIAEAEYRHRWWSQPQEGKDDFDWRAWKTFGSNPVNSALSASWLLK